MAARETTAASAFFSNSAPAEIIAHILGLCKSTRDVLALASTCRHIYGIWQANTAATLWSVWLRELPHFGDALTAVRLTRLVVDAECQGILPPMGVSPSEYSGLAQRPDFSEIQAVFGFHRLARALVTIFRIYRGYLPHDLERNDYDMEAPDRMPEWESRLHRAIYRILVAGAALAGAYNEPLFLAEKHGDPDIRCLPGVDDLGDKHFSFFAQFAVSNMEASPESEEAVFGPLGDWLLESILSDEHAKAAIAKRFAQGRGRSKHCTSREDDCPLELTGGGTHSDAHLVTWELMQMLWVYEHLGRGAWKGNDEDNIPQVAIRRPSSYSGTDVEQDDSSEAEETVQDPLKTPLVVFMGLFKAEKVSLLENISQGRRHHLQACLAVHDNRKTEDSDSDSEEGGFPVGESIAVTFNRLFRDSGRPNHIMDSSGDETEDPIAPPQLKFFEYFLRRYLGARFVDNTFGEDFEYGTRPYDEFMKSFAVFSHDDVAKRAPYYQATSEIRNADFLEGSEMLTGWAPPPERYYRGPDEW
ncbi:hypothetical protein B0H67DRAFT_486690 [Lasiosphaeris hirsuta]|uniref:F-box domain-containing protein n=1 Tax=Lasiosphaeris hirsuta TaxID=260670 RepID=A0AA40ASF9_9PEZI|nr:hypothetical protein B0H67DRAFT_486690 [Lasiosphaeris hirsuta]